MTTPRPTGSAPMRAAMRPALRMPVPGDVLGRREQRTRGLIAPDRPVVPAPDEPEAVVDAGTSELGREGGVLGAELVGGTRVRPDVGPGPAERTRDVWQRHHRAVVGDPRLV